MVIKIKENGDIDAKALTEKELSILVDIQLDYHKRQLNDMERGR